MPLLRLLLASLAVLGWASGAAAASADLPAIAIPARNGILTIAVVGDTGEGAAEVAAGIAAVHRRQPLDALLVLGDNFYPCGVTSLSDPRWELIRPLTRIGPPVLPVLGNHDYCGEARPDEQVRASGTIENWRFPARQYIAHSEIADFVFLDTTPLAHGVSGDAESALRAAFGGEISRWRIAVGHHPVISSGWHGYFPRDEVERMRRLIPALRATHTDVYIAGHDHHLEVIRGDMLHVISGAGSSPIPPIRLRVRTIFPTEIRRERIGFALLEITRRQIRVRLYDGNGKARSEWLSGRVRGQSAAE